MALRPLITKQNLPHHSPTLFCYLNPVFQCKLELPEKEIFQSNISRRIAAMTSIVLAKEAFFSQEIAKGLDFRMVTSGQTTEEAKSCIKGHAQSLLEVKTLLESESWREAQKMIRSSSPYLKQDIYTIIQSKPGNERSQLRKLYTSLFTNVSRLDYAARDQDVSRVWQCYENIAAALDDILSRI